jgi:hypothetical protein
MLLVKGGGGAKTTTRISLTESPVKLQSRYVTIVALVQDSRVATGNPSMAARFATVIVRGSRFKNNVHNSRECVYVVGRSGCL